MPYTPIGRCTCSTGESWPSRFPSSGSRLHFTLIAVYGSRAAWRPDYGGEFSQWQRLMGVAETYRSCRFRCRLNQALSGISKGEQRQITPSVNDLQISCRTFYSPAVA